jgi:hypothetical protein
MLHLIPTPIPSDLRQAASDLKDGVEVGEITGLGVVVTLRGGRFFVDCFGRLAREPHHGRGLVLSLDDCLREIAARKHGTSTTR